jgi:hypothetical protein
MHTRPDHSVVTLRAAVVIFTTTICVAPADIAGSELLTKLFYLWVAG